MIFVLVGREYSGKEDIAEAIYENYVAHNHDISPLITYTTDSKRSEPFYCVREVEEMKNLEVELDDKIISLDGCDSEHHCWDYMMTLPDDFDPQKDYVVSATLKNYHALVYYFENEYQDQKKPVEIVPIYIKISDYHWLKRAILLNKNNDLEDVCRRFLSEKEEKVDEKLEEMGFVDVYETTIFADPVDEIIEYIQAKTMRRMD